MYSTLGSTSFATIHNQLYALITCVVQSPSKGTLLNLDLPLYSTGRRLYFSSIRQGDGHIYGRMIVYTQTTMSEHNS